MSFPPGVGKEEFVLLGHRTLSPLGSIHSRYSRKDEIGEMGQGREVRAIYEMIESRVKTCKNSSCTVSTQWDGRSYQEVSSSKMTQEMMIYSERAGGIDLDWDSNKYCLFLLEGPVEWRNQV